MKMWSYQTSYLNGAIRANQSVSMTTVVNKHGVYGGGCTAVPTAQTEEKRDERRRDQVSKICRLNGVRRIQLMFYFSTGQVKPNRHVIKHQHAVMFRFSGDAF